jgi:hypothetical protein
MEIHPHPCFIRVNLWQKTRFSASAQKNAGLSVIEAEQRGYDFAASFWCIVSGLRCRDENRVGRLGEASPYLMLFGRIKIARPPTHLDSILSM